MVEKSAVNEDFGRQPSSCFMHSETCFSFFSLLAMLFNTWWVVKENLSVRNTALLEQSLFRV